MNVFLSAASSLNVDVENSLNVDLIVGIIFAYITTQRTLKIKNAPH